MPATVPPGEPPRPPLILRIAVGMIVTGLGLISSCYMLNPTMGVDFLPDAMPIFGNLDEAGATAMLLFCLSYWGFDVTRFGAVLGAWSQGRKALPPGTGTGGPPPR